ncbi:hypothetical protein KC717_04945 [Candidatus Dojkabacteria bacterium]|uniref:Uncharacterized protein n=1 Tax=Candidatus Dojkabacteria bacterium TaxID=2099670 RepID=A0A955L9B9_9BACT|nr:hypothetical protein [Candidatus Dojkabacteria bacterium]
MEKDPNTEQSKLSRFLPNILCGLLGTTIGAVVGMEAGLGSEQVLMTASGGGLFGLILPEIVRGWNGW